MTDAIALTGLTGDYRYPAILVEIGFNVGAVGGGSTSRPNVVVGPKLSTGTYTANRLYYPASDAEAQAGAGAKSAAYRMWKKFKQVSPKTKCGMICYAETSGGSPIKATTTITVTGSSSSGQQVWTLNIGSEKTTVLLPTGTVDTVAAGLMRTALVASKVIDVSGSGANVIISAPQYGTRGGTATHPTIRIWSTITGSGLVATSSTYVGATTPGAEGTTTEAANFAAALSANSGSWFYNIITDLAANGTAITAANSFVLNQALPLAGKRGTLISAYSGGLSAGITLALAQNYERYTCLWSHAYQEPPDECAAVYGAILAKYEEGDRTFNFNKYSGPDFLLTPVEDSTLYPDEQDGNDAIVGGMAPGMVTPAGKAMLGKATTTKVRDSGGTYYLWGAYERHRVSGADDFGDRMASTMAIASQGQKLADDPVDARGKIVYNRNRPRGIVYPHTIRPKVVNVLRQEEAAGQCQRVEESIAGLQVLRSTDNRGRVLISVPYWTIDLFDQTAIYIAESTPG